MVQLDGVLLDIDGVLVVSWKPIEGAAAAVEALRQGGLPIRFVTNTTSISRQEITVRLREAGVAVDPEEIHSAPAATAAWIQTNRPGTRCYLINSGNLGDDLDGIELVGDDEPADLVVLGGAGPEFSYTQMNHALGLLLDGAELIGMHRNWYWRTVDGFALDTGAYLAALEGAAQTDAVVLGKPSPDFFLTAVDALGCARGQVAMVGDDLENDVLAAEAVGLRGVLVRTGKYRPGALDAAPARPETVIDSIVDLPALLGVV